MTDKETAIEPKKILTQGYGHLITMGACPRCGHWTYEAKPYCPYCGQKIKTQKEILK